MKITYDGPHDAVTVPALNATVKRGESVDAPDAIAEQLIAQGWKRPAAKPTTAAKKAAPKENK